MAHAIRKILILIEDEKVKVLRKEGKYILVEKTSQKTYLDVSTEEAMGKVALSILKRRFGGNKPRMKLQKPLEPLDCGIVQSIYESLDKESQEYEKATALIEESIAAQKQYETRLAEYEIIMKCIEEEDTRLAPAILESRRNLAGEDYDITFLYDECVS